jgi:hypothetical protein
MRYWVEGSSVLHERVDDEVILIHMISGAYASLRGTGADAWEAVAAGRDADECGRLLAQRYEVSETDAAEAVTELVSELVAHDLVCERPDHMPVEQPALDAPQGRLAWTPPSIAVYTDMQDFLRLDPIHEVTPAGWPHANAG